ncbi:MAG: toxin-antitoxin system HicB family antitoxin [Candidatus Binataceae bacterium]
MANMTLQDFRKLPYRAELRFDREDNRWFVAFPELPGCEADGATREEALSKGDEVKDLWFEMAIEAHRTIPEPEPEPSYSGRFVVRLPKTLHEKAAKFAMREGVSLNTLVVQIMSEGVERFSMRRTAIRPVTRGRRANSDKRQARRGTNQHALMPSG